ncbi:MAG: hypothetical protein O7G86_11400 [Gammaproteobacteria bacterium]|nr:hypothetical protein [Gammaproteobacteria bacterium]MCZ6854513.1 hypothetical protein [Gammaproteobacteria bacterium]
MSVELLDSPRFYGFRVRRQIGGKTYQEYFSLKENGKRIRGAKRATARSRADLRDAELAALQKKAREKTAKEVHRDSKGQVRGILCRLKSEKSGSKTPVFQIGVMSQLQNKIVNTTVSINRYGVDEAWQKAVDFFVMHKKISKRSRAYKELLDAKPSPAQVRRLTGQSSKKRKR